MVNPINGPNDPLTTPVPPSEPVVTSTSLPSSFYDDMSAIVQAAFQDSSSGITNTDGFYEGDANTIYPNLTDMERKFAGFIKANVMAYQLYGTALGTFKDWDSLVAGFQAWMTDLPTVLNVPLADLTTNVIPPRIYPYAVGAGSTYGDALSTVIPQQFHTFLDDGDWETILNTPSTANPNGSTINFSSDDNFTNAINSYLATFNSQVPSLTTSYDAFTAPVGFPLGFSASARLTDVIPSPQFYQTLPSGDKVPYPYVRIGNPFLSNPFDSTSTKVVDYGVESGDDTLSSNFLSGWDTYIGATGQDNTTNMVSTFQAVYTGFAPSGSTHQDFVVELQNFYKSLNIPAGTPFVPATYYGQWVTHIMNKYVNTQVDGATKLGPAPDYLITGSSLDGNSSDKLLVINRILALIIKMIGILQDIGIAQANHLSYTTEYEAAYTQLQKQIPIFIQDGTKPIGLATDTAAKARNDLNATVNGFLTDNIRNYRTLQDDSAKQQQSNLNQTNDAVNQQTDMATTFIQQLTTLMSSIFR